MDFLILLEAVIKLGIPMIVLSWVIFTWLYGGGDIDRDSDRKSINAQVKKMKKSFKRKKDGGHANYVLGKWMWFGSGFYGLAGLWTFFVTELSDVLRILFNPSSLAGTLDEGFISALIQVGVNQLGNLLSAFVWFGYWSDEGVIIWLLVAYFGYWIGVELARRGENLPIQVWPKKLREFFPRQR